MLKSLGILAALAVPALSFSESRHGMRKYLPESAFLPENLNVLDTRAFEPRGNKGNHTQRYHNDKTKGEFEFPH